MNPKQLMAISAMAIVITLSVVAGDHAKANGLYGTAGKSCNITIQDDDFHEALGVSSDEQVRDALYSGKSLADIARDNHKDVQLIIDLQIAQLSEQLRLRLASGELTAEQYASYMEELPDMVATSVHGHPTT